MRNILRLFLVSLIIHSCASLTAPLNENRVEISKSSFKKFNGTYQNFSIDSTKRRIPSLWMILGIENYSKPGWRETIVELEFINKNTAKAKLIGKNGKVLKRKRIYGRINNGYFYVRRKFLLVPFAPLVFGYINEKSRFCLVDNYLHIESSWNIWGFAVVAGTDEKEQISFRCEKLK
ncbi:MAG TPA: hypothetical protein P5132_06480 [Bacteroidales bacterium]|nr:hypothetical protein [Bacteroidales bacterium]